MCDATKLHVITYGGPCGILVHASLSAVGCCLIQWSDDGKEKPIAFASSKLTPTQMAWSTIEKEAYAVTYTLRKYRNFVFAANVIVFFLITIRSCISGNAHQKVPN